MITRLLLVLVLTAMASTSHADTQVALDYHAKVKGCPSADRFADEVAAKLGFVPWDPQASTAVRVRIASDSGQLVGTIEQPDGTSKVLRADTCAQLSEALVAAIGVALDRTPAAAPAPKAKPEERRLQKLERDDGDTIVTVQLRSKDARELEISRVLSNTMVYGYNARAALIEYEKVCKAPCTAKLPEGTHTLIVRDVANDMAVAQEATLKVNSTLELEYTSRADVRRTTRSRTGWGLTLGFVAGTIATGYYLEENFEHMSPGLHIGLDPLGGVVGALVGAIIGRLVSPGSPSDEARITVRPGLQNDATAGF